MTDRIIREKDGDLLQKEISLLDGEVISGLGPQTLRILEKLAEKETYPKRLADELGIHEQKVYYHVRKLEDAGLVEAYERRRVGGALCKFYRATSEAFGFALTDEWRGAGRGKLDVPEEILDFLSEFIGEGTFRGSIVAGSPRQHGPFMTSARDGHYAVQLGIFLGKFCDLEDRFVVKLDTEVKAEGALDRHLLLIGGPITNTVSRDLNEGLGVRFDWEERWKIISERSGREYQGENLGLIAKIRRGDYARVLLSGLDSKGTKACIIGITQQPGKVLEGYRRGEDFYRVIEGLDRDGDGKTDDVEVLE